MNNTLITTRCMTVSLMTAAMNRLHRPRPFEQVIFENNLKEYGYTMNRDLIPFEQSTPLPKYNYIPSIWLTDEQYDAIYEAQTIRAQQRMMGSKQLHIIPEEEEDEDEVSSFPLSLNKPIVQIDDDNKLEGYTIGVHGHIIPIEYSTPSPFEAPIFMMPIRHYNALQKKLANTFP